MPPHLTWTHLPWSLLQCFLASNPSLPSILPFSGLSRLFWWWLHLLATPSNLGEPLLFPFITFLLWSGPGYRPRPRFLFFNTELPLLISLVQISGTSPNHVIFSQGSLGLPYAISSALRVFSLMLQDWVQTFFFPRKISYHPLRRT